MRAAVLVFNLREENLGRLRYLCMQARAELRVMDAAACERPLRDALKTTGADPDIPLPFPETLAVFCGLTGGALDSLLDALRQPGMPPVDYRAVLTATNRAWTPLRLMAELRAERAALATNDKEERP